MPAKLLIVEDEPIVALDLQQELQEFGCEVTGLAESAEAALFSVEENRPDLALMDIRIDGSMDGIQTARLLRHAYQIPVIFLTSYSDRETLARAAYELPYGYLTKPFRPLELKSTLSVALHKAAVDADMRRTNGLLSLTVQHTHEAIVFVSPDGAIEFMNRPAEEMAGLALLRARRLLFSEAFNLTNIFEHVIPMPIRRGEAASTEEFGWFLRVPGRERQIVDFTVRSLIADDGAHGGHVVTLRNAELRMRHNLIEASNREAETFDNAPLSMVQLDGDGRVMRINQKLLDESELPFEHLVGRCLSDLLADPDPRITRQFVSRLLRPFRPAQPLLAT